MRLPLRASSYLWVLAHLERNLVGVALTPAGELLVYVPPKLARWCATRLDLPGVSVVENPSPYRKRDVRSVGGGGNTRAAVTRPAFSTNFHPVVPRPPGVESRVSTLGAAGLWERDDMGRTVAARRIRSLKPELLDSESLGRCSFGAQNLFTRLFLISDDHGRFRSGPEYVASVCFPYQRTAQRYVRGWLSELSREGIVIVYVVDRDSYAFFPNWERHQRIDNPGDPKYPPPPSLGINRDESPQEGRGADLNGPGSDLSTNVEKFVGKGSDNPVLGPFWDHQKRRAKLGLKAERLPKTDTLERWGGEWLSLIDFADNGEHSGPRMTKAADFYFDDKFWEAKGFPFAGYISQARDLVARIRVGP